MASDTSIQTLRNQIAVAEACSQIIVKRKDVYV